MKKAGIRILKGIGYFLLIPIIYLVVSMIFSLISIERESNNQVLDKTIYLTTNGVHLDIVLPIYNVAPEILSGLQYQSTDQYFSLGWGDENFYINTPTWGDLTLKNAFNALFLNSTTLIHLSRYHTKKANWVEIKISDSELQKLNSYLLKSFQTNPKGEKILLDQKGYTSNDDFYKAKGSYSCFKTCNSWVNSAFKESGLKSCLWTPFDFALLRKYEQQ